MTFDSRTSLIDQDEQSIYAASDEDEGTHIWIQPSLSHEFMESGISVIINGIFARTQKSEKTRTMIDTELDLELTAWDAASDEALFLFEKELD